MKKARKILFYLIIILFSYGLVANIGHIISINKKYNYSFDDSIELLSIKSSLNTLQKDTERIKQMENSTLGKDILDAYVQILENFNEKITSYDFINYKGNVKLKQKDLYQMIYDYGNLNSTNFLNVYKKVAEKNSTLNEQNLTWEIYTMTLSSNYIYQNLIDNYAYNNLTKTDEYTVSTILSLYQEKLNIVNMINKYIISTEVVLESSEINE